jgi:hypothetical protein
LLMEYSPAFLETMEEDRNGMPRDFGPSRELEEVSLGNELERSSNSKSSNVSSADLKLKLSSESKLFDRFPSDALLEDDGAVTELFLVIVDGFSCL